MLEKEVDSFAEAVWIVAKGFCRVQEGFSWWLEDVC